MKTRWDKKHTSLAVKPIFQMTNVIKQPNSQKQWWLHQAVYCTIAHAATIKYYRKQNHQRTTSDTTSVDAELDSIPLNKAAAKLCLLDSIFLSDALSFVAKACNTKFCIYSTQKYCSERSTCTLEIRKQCPHCTKSQNSTTCEAGYEQNTQITNFCLIINRCQNHCHKI